MSNIIPINSEARSSRMAEVRDEFDRFEWMRGWMRDDQIDSSTTKAVLAALFDHMGKSGKCWPSISTIADLASCHPRTARRHISIAASLGWIQATERNGDSNIYAASHPRHSATPDTAPPRAQDQGRGGTAPPPPRAQRHPTPGTAPPKQTKEQTIRTDQEQTKAAAAGASTPEGEREAHPDRDSDDLSQWILTRLNEHGLPANSMTPVQIVDRLMQGPLDRDDWRAYLVDDIADKAERTGIPRGEPGHLRGRQAIKYIGQTSDAQTWLDRRDGRRGSSSGAPDDLEKGFFDDVPDEAQMPNIDPDIF